MSSVAIVTGCNTGIGLETARELVAKGYVVVFACRDQAKAEAAMAAVESETGAPTSTVLPGVTRRVHFIQLDNARMESVKSFAEVFKKRFNRLDALVLNAGVGYVKREDRRTVDGLDTQFQVNYLAHWLLLQLLTPVLKSTRGARLVCLTSVEHRKGTADWEKHSQKTSIDSYPSGKLAMALLAFEFANRTGLPAVAANPGAVRSDIWRYLRSSIKDQLFKVAMNMLFLSPNQGCQTSVYGATADLPDGEAIYVSPYPADKCCTKYLDMLGPYAGPTVVKAAPLVYDRAAQRTLWEFSAQASAKWL
jgi:NAD(P)-dependent dehydrogenase (short-subunit alcohol dehydrogenase family)